MLQYIVKVIISAVVLVSISEFAKRSSLLAATLASIPLTSLLAFIWIYIETGNNQQISNLSKSIFWLVLPSLVLFIALPLLLDKGIDFWLSLAIACFLTVIAYFGMIQLLNVFNIHF